MYTLNVYIAYNHYAHCNQLLLLLQHQNSRIETMTSLETSVNWTEQASAARVELSVPRELVRFSLPNIENTEEAQ